MQNLRRLSQGIFLMLFLFLFLQTESKGADELGYPVKLFLDFDPLILLTTLLSAHAVQRAFYLSLIVIAATVLMGRIFCGWICPLGTLNNMVSSFKRKRAPALRVNWTKAKYYILVFLIISSLFTVQLAGIMDPLSLLIRSLSVSIYPLFNYSVRAAFETMYEMNPPVIVDASEAVYSSLKDNVLAFRQPLFHQSFFLGLIFIAILGLNLLETRFWCRNLCPLGALLGVLSRYSFLKRSVSDGCNECGACVSSCQGRAEPDRKDAWKSSECMYCWNCDDVCPQNAVSFGFGGERSPYGLDLGRRRVIASAAGGALAVPLLRGTPLSASTRMNPLLIRTPGALKEREFLKRCIRCGECMKVCLTNGLQPTLFEAGLEGLWSPLLVPKAGYCEYRCTLCGQVCPTGAISELPIKEKVEVKIGLATISKSRCLPYAHATPCIVCEEVCPTPKKAVWFQHAQVTDRKGRTRDIQQPRVDADLCIGCGICEAKCPVISEPAIYVTNMNETRSGGNRLLL